MSYGESWRFEGSLAEVESGARKIAEAAGVELAFHYAEPRVTLRFTMASGRIIEVEGASYDEDEILFVSADQGDCDNALEWQVATSLVEELAPRVGTKIIDDDIREDFRCIQLAGRLNSKTFVEAASLVKEAMGDITRLEVESSLPPRSVDFCYMVPMSQLDSAVKQIEPTSMDQVALVDPPQDGAEHHNVIVCAAQDDDGVEIHAESNDGENRAAWPLPLIFARQIAERIGAVSTDDIDGELLERMSRVPRVAKLN